MAERLDGKRIAAAELADLATEVAAFRAAGGPQPQLVAVIVGDDPASRVYVRNKERAAAAAGVASRVLSLSAATTPEELLAALGVLNADPTVHGVLVQLPLPAGLPERLATEGVAAAKDVDCFHPENVGRLAQGEPRFVPCTPAAVLAILDRSGIATAGRHAVVVGRSNIVGRPLANLLAGKGRDATVTLCHSRTENLAEHTRRAAILVAAAGRPGLVTADMVAPGATVIDVGTNRLPDGRLVGDVDFDGVEPVAGAITPVPGGVGPMTCAMVVRNTVAAARLAHAAGIAAAG